VNKTQIRKKILDIRKKNEKKKLQINFQDIFRTLQKSKFVGKIVGGYYPYNYEVDTTKILKQFEKKKYLISLPKIKKNSQMEFFQWSSKEPLSINKHGIPEPISGKIIYPDILLVPVVAFDKNFNRIGYGGGFYDRYIKRIKKNKNIITIGLAYSFQEVEKIQINKNDMKLNFIVTNKKD
tara:strand:+ start:215 stop:754 length:540 start_codon:yes stop_codon:yes gene_type:complete